MQGNLPDHRGLENGIVTIYQGAVQERINSIWIKTYHE